MSSVVHTVRLAQVADLEVRAWRNWVKAELLAGQPTGYSVWDPDGGAAGRADDGAAARRRRPRSDPARTSVAPTTGYFALTEVALAMHAFEREATSSSRCA